MKIRLEHPTTYQVIDDEHLDQGHKWPWTKKTLLACQYLKSKQAMIATGLKLTVLLFSFFVFFIQNYSSKTDDKMFKLFTMHLRLAKFTGLHDAVPMHPTHANLRENFNRIGLLNWELDCLQ